ncbi:MAG TPA: hypothetical protein VFC44_27605 [Candidatus Saccharimonadales bacterium]|nr:hypothetical protein [Candidatus Saccharimonadales bacterium]
MPENSAEREIRIWIVFIVSVMADRNWLLPPAAKAKKWRQKDWEQIFCPHLFAFLSAMTSSQDRPRFFKICSAGFTLIWFNLLKSPTDDLHKSTEKAAKVVALSLWLNPSRRSLDFTTISQPWAAALFRSVALGRLVPFSSSIPITFPFYPKTRNLCRSPFAQFFQRLRGWLSRRDAHGAR